MLQVEIAKHHNEDAFSHGFVLGIADRLRAAGAELRCREHGGDPTVRLSTEGLAQTVNQIHIDVSGCCAAVVERVGRLLEDVRQHVDCEP